jgi:hypothetical protein
MQTRATKSGATFRKITWATPTSKTAAVTKKTATTPTKTLTVLPAVVTMSATYTQIRTIIGAIYKVPYFTLINEVSIAAGGPGTTRATPLTFTLNLEIFVTAHPTTKKLDTTAKWCTKPKGST